MTSDWTRRDFVTQSTLAFGTAGLFPGPNRGAVPHSGSEEQAAVYSEFLQKSIDELPTPALLIDLDVFERNLKTMDEFCRRKDTRYRPHAKAHKSPVIGRKQLASGATGLCAAKLGEAEVLVAGGITDVLI